MTGWAVDQLSQKAASRVYLMIGDNLFLAEVGIARPDVAGFHNMPSYSRSGWKLEIPSEMVGEGVHPLRLIIINHNGTGYYSVTDKRKLLVQ